MPRLDITGSCAASPCPGSTTRSAARRSASSGWSSFARSAPRCHHQFAAHCWHAAVPCPAGECQLPALLALVGDVVLSEAVDAREQTRCRKKAGGLDLDKLRT
jgi:hypothetical protein